MKKRTTVKTVRGLIVFYKNILNMLFFLKNNSWLLWIPLLLFLMIYPVDDTLEQIVFLQRLML